MDVDDEDDQEDTCNWGTWSHWWKGVQEEVVHDFDASARVPHWWVRIVFHTRNMRGTWIVSMRGYWEP